MISMFEVNAQLDIGILEKVVDVDVE